jgi:hypothetical protein
VQAIERKLPHAPGGDHGAVLPALTHQAISTRTGRTGQ